MSYTAQPSSHRVASRIFTITVQAVGVDDVTAEEFERDIAEAIAERLDAATTVKAEELPF